MTDESVRLSLRMEAEDESIPDPPFTSGPYLYVAWPGELDKVLP